MYPMQHTLPVIQTHHPLPAQRESRAVISLSLGTSKIPQTEQTDSPTDNIYSILPVLNNFPLNTTLYAGRNHTPIHSLVELPQSP